MRWAAQRDAVEKKVIEALQLAGWHVEQVSAPGFPDLLCVRRGELHLLEVKSPGGRLEVAQVEFHARVRAAGLVVAVVTTPEEALAAVRGEVLRTALTEPAVRPKGKPRSFAELATPNTRQPRRRKP